MVVEAGTFAVPENRARPTGRVIEIPYYRLRSASKQPATAIDKISLIGSSYGTHLALALMRQFPRTIERVVLSGVEGPDHTWDDPAGKLAALTRIAAAIEASPAFRGQIPEGGLLGALRTVIQRLESEPVTVTITRQGRETPVVVDATIERLAASARAGRRSRPMAWPSMILEMYRGVDVRGDRRRPRMPRGHRAFAHSLCESGVEGGLVGARWARRCEPLKKGSCA